MPLPQGVYAAYRRSVRANCPRLESQRPRLCLRAAGKRIKLRPANIASRLLFNTLIPTDACSSTRAPASSWNARSDQAVFIRRGERFRASLGEKKTENVQPLRNFKVGGAFCRTAIRARARLLQPYKAVFRWCCAMPSQRNRRCGRRCRRLGYRDLGRHPTLHRPVSWHLEQHG